MTRSYSLPGSSKMPIDPIDSVVGALKEGRRFLLVTHKDPDVDGIGSMLSLGKAMLNAKKNVVLLADDPVVAPISRLKGAEKIVRGVDAEEYFDAVVALDCSEFSRLGGSLGSLEGLVPLINIDHHETNDFFGDLKFIDPDSSSTGELVFRVIKLAGFPLDLEVAENIFAAIQADTGSFSYGNSTPESLRIAAEMIEYGVKPWEVSRNMINYTLARLKLLQMALGTIEFHYGDKIGMMVLSSDMFERARAHRLDGERFVDYPRFVSGVEIAVLIRQTGEHGYKFSIRSNGRVNVARLASRFGGGGHAMAAGFECSRPIEEFKRNFLREAGRLLDGALNHNVARVEGVADPRHQG